MTVSLVYLPMGFLTIRSILAFGRFSVNKLIKLFLYFFEIYKVCQTLPPIEADRFKMVGFIMTYF